MDSFELNKIIGAILGTLLFVMGVGFLADGIYAPIADNGPGYELPKPAASTTASAAAPAAVPLATLLAAADPKAGEETARACQACHNFAEGAGAKIGPDLYGVVGRKIASQPGFAYSDAIKKFADKTWTYEQLNTWLTSPAAMAPGTKMTFAGLSDEGDRANVLAYLRTLSTSPVAFPAPPAAKPAASSSTPAATPATPAPTGSTAPTTPAPATPAVTAPAAAAPAPATPAATAPATPAPASPAPAAPANTGTAPAGNPS